MGCITILGERVPYKFGDVFDDSPLYDYNMCPYLCGASLSDMAKNRQRDAVCANGHKWHTCAFKEIMPGHHHEDLVVCQHKIIYQFAKGGTGSVLTLEGLEHGFAQDDWLKTYIQAVSAGSRLSFTAWLAHIGLKPKEGVKRIEVYLPPNQRW